MNAFSLPALTAKPPYPWPNHPPSGQPRPKHATHKRPCIEKLSPGSLLELAAGRWLVEYWSQPPTFSAPELHEMLVQAVSSIARERLLGSTSRRGGGDGRGRGRSSGDIQDTFVKDGVRDSPELTEAPSPAGGVQALTGWLEGRGSEVSGVALAAACRFSRWFIDYRAVMAVLSLVLHRVKIVDRGGGQMLSVSASFPACWGRGYRVVVGVFVVFVVGWYLIAAKSRCRAFQVVPEG